MAQQRVDQADVPALALFLQVTQIIRRLGPADRVRQELDGIGALAFQHVLVELDHQFHVLADAAGRIAPCVDDELLVERPEGAGNDEQHAHLVKTDAPRQESPQILVRLQHQQRLVGQVDLPQFSVHDLAAAGDADDAAHRHAFRVDHEGIDDLGQRGFLQDGVRVDGHEHRIHGDVDPCVQGVCLPSVFLVHYDQVRILRRTVQCADFLRGNGALVGLVDLDQMERILQQFQRIVFRAVVDDDDFVMSEIQGQEVPGVVHDGGRFVVGRNEDADGHHVVRERIAGIVRIL